MKTFKRYLPLWVVLLAALVALPLYAVDLSITPAGVVPASGYSYVDGIAGETITAGQTLYLKSSDLRYWKADSDASSATATLIGIALNGASAGQPVRVQTGGGIDPEATVTVGEIYVLSDTAGGIMPEGDLEQGDYVSIIGIGTSATNIAMKVHNSGVTVP